MAALEFAIIAPLFFFLMFVIAETAMVFIAGQVMDNAVFESARLIRTGQVQAGFSESDFEAAVCSRMSVFVDCEDSADFFLEVKSYDTFAEMVTTRPVDEDDNFEEPSGYEFGEPSSIVVVRAYYQWPINPIMGLQWSNRLSNGKLLIGSFAAFRNEPYTTTAQAE